MELLAVVSRDGKPWPNNYCGVNAGQRGVWRRLDKQQRGETTSNHLH